MYLDSCKEMVVTGEEIRRGDLKKCKLEESLEAVNGQLLVMNRHYTFLQQKNFHLKAAYLKKLTFTKPTVSQVTGIVQKARKVECDFEDDDSEDLVRACEQVEDGHI